LPFDDQAAFEDRIKTHPDEKHGIWIEFARKGTEISSISYDGAVESALCYGWIDGKVASLDALYFLHMLLPRRTYSKWSRRNLEKAEALIASGRMQPAGYPQAQLTWQDGRWDGAFVPQSTISIAADFQLALDQNPQAQQFFLTLSSINRNAILHRLQITKKPSARSVKIQKYVEMLANNVSLYPGR
jgi:uncharacterized protein YdeI (YjbR/CyaY-like superfamily)